ncbi:DUF6090 family protein [Psychroserpens luteolus]|uniref:DUF6090 family protein n=1 Tax=Psychroserpens luteolus TaxID=2855840 RepID=UPI001E44A722|nr:DUF6090 family protein [Psychroserpens luteolus]MCD2258856.1 hypothetical protein [Psychroserpens luteolus]
MSIFNTKRMAALSKKGIFKYITYGIGEIILVVIGILIAVNINNKNQERNAQKKLQSYLQVYQQDLEQDTLVVGQVLKYVDDRKEFFKLFLSDTVTAQTYQKNLEGFGLVLSYSPFKLQKKGINLLENYVNDNETEQDTLISRILTNYRAFDNLLVETNERIGDDIDNNLLYFKENEPWIADLLMGRISNPDMLTYFLSDSYRARLAIHSTLIYGNLEPMLKGLQKYNKETLEMLNKRLEE